MGISSLTPAVLPVDRQGKPLRPAMLYSLDVLAEQEIADLNKILGKDYSLKANGRPISPKSTGPKMLWLKRHEPEVFDKTSYYMGAVTFLVYRLTGSFVARLWMLQISRASFLHEKSSDGDEKSAGSAVSGKEQLPELKFATELEER